MPGRKAGVLTKRVWPRVTADARCSARWRGVARGSAKILLGLQRVQGEESAGGPRRGGRGERVPGGGGGGGGDGGTERKGRGGGGGRGEPARGVQRVRGGGPRALAGSATVAGGGVGGRAETGGQRDRDDGGGGIGGEPRPSGCNDCRWRLGAPDGAFERIWRAIASAQRLQVERSAVSPGGRAAASPTSRRTVPDQAEAAMIAGRASRPGRQRSPRA